MPVSLREGRVNRRGRKDAVRDGAAPSATQRAISAAELKRLSKGSYAAHQSLQEAVLRLLAAFGVEAVPLNTGPRVAPRAGGGFDLRSNKAQRGIADVLACFPPNGRLALLELKTGGAVQSEHQKRTNARFARMGALCLTVRSALELMPHLRGLPGATDVGVAHGNFSSLTPAKFGPLEVFNARGQKISPQLLRSLYSPSTAFRRLTAKKSK